MGILYDARKVKAYESLLMVGKAVGFEEEWCDRLWAEIILSEELYEELVYYLENHSLVEKMKCYGYSLIDLYVWQMNRYNVIGDCGKNTATCNKDRMVLKAFYDMALMQKDPEGFIKKLTEGRGMDK